MDSRPDTSVIFLTITISASLIILSAVAYFLYYLWYSLLRMSRTSPIFHATSPLNKLQKFSYGELRNATNNFDPSNSIGKGGSGTVYRGILKDGTNIAVKLLDLTSIQSEKEFRNELKILGGLRKSSPFVVSFLGFCEERCKRLVVYEYIPNRSLQELLFADTNAINSSSNVDCPCLNWSMRFSIVKDVAKALAFLHLECDPPVIHGDVKPSNVLLDSEFRAKLSDFGLSRLKLDNEFGVDLFSQDLGKSQDLWKSQELSGISNSGVGIGSEKNASTPQIGTPVESYENDHEVDFALALQASSSSKNSCKIYHNVMGLPISSLSFGANEGGNECKSVSDLKGKELMPGDENVGEVWNKFVPYNEDELGSIDHGKEFKSNGNDNNSSNDTSTKQWGKDWWWRQDGSGELCSKDYVMEWIGSQICHSSDPDWDEEKGPIQEKPDLDNFDSNNNPVQEPVFECPNSELESCEKRKVRAKKHRKMHEWWKEENSQELDKKCASARRKVSLIKDRFRVRVPHFGLGKCFEFRINMKFDCENDTTNSEEDQNPDFSFRKGTVSKLKKNSRSMGSDMDLFSRELSSTTSMRGTLCYIAPEYNGYGYLMEKSDIYSFGVLILVIISGRRPLHVLSSPMKLEKANLISWCRSLAHCGNVLELVDERLREEYNREEASLCINLALACLQKMPESRPDIADVVKVLEGKMDMPMVSFEFSPSPPSKINSRSRRKQKSYQD